MGGGLRGRFSHLQVPVTVLQHDDGIVDTSPIASTTPSSVSTLIEKLEHIAKKIDPISDTGIVTNGISVERNERSNMKIATTSATLRHRPVHGFDRAR